LHRLREKEMRKQKTFEELLDIQYGTEGSPKRTAFEEKALLFEISEMLKDARKQAGMTQEQLALKMGTKKSYISRLENGKCDIQLSTLYRLFEDGLGKKVTITID
jgi:ribosome-binding protein aMBF1 (putative translation factor)